MSIYTDHCCACAGVCYHTREAAAYCEAHAGLAMAQPISEQRIREIVREEIKEAKNYKHPECHICNPKPDQKVEITKEQLKAALNSAYHYCHEINRNCSTFEALSKELGFKE